MTSRKLQIFRFVLVEMFSPYFLNSLAISLLFRSDCGPLGRSQNQDRIPDRTPDRIALRIGSNRTGIFACGAELLFGEKLF